MNYGDVVKRLAPCGLDCSRCADYEGGEIRQLSLRLGQLLNNYERVAGMKAGQDPVFGNYSHFKEILASFSRGQCGGCRSDNVRCPIECLARACHREKGVDFCFQCVDYPCGGQFDWSDAMRGRWLKRNGRMKEIGVVEFYLEQKELPRY